MSGGDFFFSIFFQFFFPKSLKSASFSQIFRTRKYEDDTKKSARTTCQATCQRHITREFGPKSKKKMSGGEKSKKKCF